MDTLIAFLSKNYIIFIIITIFLIFALVGYIIDTKTINTKDTKQNKEDEPKDETLKEETATLTSMMNRQMNNPDIVDAKLGESDNHKDNVEQL
ncbi:MAG: hypothetical protein SOZ04_05375 [Bacilli bacterium]|nr:hypothetical protein [Bacilli bacterium]